MSTTTVIISVILSFILTGVTANWLIYRWQYRNWMNQQKFLGSEKKYEALKSHADEISRLASRRLSSMFRVVFAFDQSDDRLEERRKLYSDSVDDWNQNISSFFYKTTLYFSWEMTQRLEHDINARFVSIGSKIDKSIRILQSKDAILQIPKTSMLQELYSLQGELGNFNRDMLRHVIKQQSATYHGVELRYNESDLQYFSTWHLVKALFVTRVEDFRVVLTAFELEKPARRSD
ncbi:hypothetical protein [Methylorubrum extorquens]